MGSRENTYESKRTEDSLESLSDKLKISLRLQIRSLSSHPPLSEPWIKQTATYQTLSISSNAESKLPREKEGSTLWETEEASLRYVLEDGKLNLCLRNMVEFKRFERAGYTTNDKSHEKDKSDTFTGDNKEAMNRFEEGLGIVLNNAWKHIEAIQTTDVTLLVNYVADVYEYAEENYDIVKTNVFAGSVGRGVMKRQETTVINYILSVMTRVDDLSEDRIMPLVKERRIFGLLVRFLNTWSEKLKLLDVDGGESEGVEVLSKYSETLSLIIQTEDFQTYKPEFVNEGLRDIVVEWCDSDGEGWLDVICEDDDDVRRKSRPLLDFVKECKRRRK